jgi:hypothetical protein
MMTRAVEEADARQVAKALSRPAGILASWDRASGDVVCLVETLGNTAGAAAALGQDVSDGERRPVRGLDRQALAADVLRAVRAGFAASQEQQQWHAGEWGGRSGGGLGMSACLAANCHVDIMIDDARRYPLFLHLQQACACRPWPKK